MNRVIARTCTLVRAAGESGKQPQKQVAISGIRHVAAFVLLGDPGMGKSTAFKQEKAEMGEEAEFFTVRDFLTFNVAGRPGIQRKTLFIDALDEARSGSGDPRGPLDQVRAKLERLGNPKFRISCRPADWLGSNDRENLMKVSPDSEIAVYSLDPLTDSDVESLLPEFGVRNPREFAIEARQRNVHGFLKNPQNLELLVKSTAASRDWPSGQSQLFERACRQLAIEQNSDHRTASGQPAVEGLLDAAGFLSALLLISGHTHVNLGISSAGGSELPLDACDYEPRHLLRAALSTNLFRTEGEEGFEPLHRRVAEFLAGRYLARLIARNHPVRRILALVSGHDGGVASSLRGLTAWLATLSPLARTELIQRDPVGLAAYGDLKAFAVGEKTTLIGLLSGELANLVSAWSHKLAFGSLVSPDTESAVCELLNVRNPDPANIVTAEFVLDLVPGSPHLPNLETQILRVLVSDTWPGSVRESALKAYVRNAPASPQKTAEMHSVLRRVVAGRLPDSLGELRGILLSELYPREVSASEIWDHLIDGEHSLFFGEYWRFWSRELPRKSSPEDLMILLDQLHLRVEQLLPILHSRGLLGAQSNWLAAGLRAVGDGTDPVRLHQWLSTGLNSAYPQGISNDEDRQFIEDWLEQRPQLQLEISSVCIKDWPLSDGSFRNFHTYSQCLRGSRPPEGYGLWCLSQVPDYAGSEPQKALMLLQIAAEEFREQGTDSGISTEALRRHTADYDYLSSALQRFLADPETEEPQDEARSSPIRETRVDPERAAWLDHLREQLGALHANECDPRDLYLLGREAIGLPGVSGASGTLRDRLAELLDEDDALVDAASAAICGSPFREDIPEVDETLHLRAQSRISLLDFAVLVGMDEIGARKPALLDNLADRQIRNALAIYFCVPTGRSSDPGWFRHYLANRTGTVADVVCQFFVAELRNRADPLNLAYYLAQRPEYAKLANLICFRLLKSFPVRCNLAQARVLDQLLLAAIQHTDPTETGGVISAKLGSKSLLPAPRVRFLAAAAILDPDNRSQRLKAFLAANPQHARHLVEFLGSDGVLTAVKSRVTAALAKEFIEIIGRKFGPYAKSGWVGHEQLASDIVEQCLRLLRTDPSEAATLALSGLATNPGLDKWAYGIAMARSEQLVLRRDVSFEHPKTSVVCESLRAGLPANVADLAALVDEQLNTLAVRIRYENTNDWRQFWDEGRGDEGPKPKHEDHCRDAILSDLRLILPVGVTAEREGHYANDARADIKVFCDDYHVPVELKKHIHRDLWTSPMNQLIGKYASNPATGGYGIFLALWFGREFPFTSAPSSGPLPESADELANCLRNQLSAHQARKIFVRVIDVSRPN